MQIFLIVMFFLLCRKSTTAITPSLPSPVSTSTSTLRYRLQKLNACYVSASLQITKIDAALKAKKHEQSEILSKIKGMELSKANLLNDQCCIMWQILTMGSPTPFLMKSPMKVLPQKTPTSSPIKSPMKVSPQKTPAPSPMKFPMKVLPQKTITKFVLPLPVKATPSTSKHGEKGGILMIYLMMMDWKVLCQEYQKLGRTEIATL